MRKYYAEQAIWGRDGTQILVFPSKTERDTYVKSHDYSNRITAAEAYSRGYKNVDIKTTIDI